MHLFFSHQNSAPVLQHEGKRKVTAMLHVLKRVHLKDKRGELCCKLSPARVCPEYALPQLASLLPQLTERVSREMRVRASLSRIQRNQYVCNGEVTGSCTGEEISEKLLAGTESACADQFQPLSRELYLRRSMLKVLPNMLFLSSPKLSALSGLWQYNSTLIFQIRYMEGNE